MGMFGDGSSHVNDRMFPFNGQPLHGIIHSDVVIGISHGSLNEIRHSSPPYMQRCYASNEWKKCMVCASRNQFVSEVLLAFSINGWSFVAPIQSLD